MYLIGRRRDCNYQTPARFRQGFPAARARWTAPGRGLQQPAPAPPGRLAPTEALMRRSLLAVPALALPLLLSGVPAPAGGRPDKGKELPLLVRDDFSGGAGRWEPTDPAAWKVVQTDRGKV